MLVPFRLTIHYCCTCTSTYISCDQIYMNSTRPIALYPGLDPKHMHCQSLSTKPCTSTCSLVTGPEDTTPLVPICKFYRTCIMCIEVTMWGRKGCSLSPRPDPGTRLEATTTPVPRLLRYPKLVGKGQKYFRADHEMTEIGRTYTHTQYARYKTVSI